MLHANHLILSCPFYNKVAWMGFKGAFSYQKSSTCHFLRFSGRGRKLNVHYSDWNFNPILENANPWA